jgi:hypothetical protein
VIGYCHEQLKRIQENGVETKHSMKMHDIGVLEKFKEIFIQLELQIN